MDEMEIMLREDYIKLGQAIKAAGLAESGVEAKYMIQDGEVMVNGETSFQRGKKLYGGDVITCGNRVVRIKSPETGGVAAEK